MKAWMYQRRSLTEHPIAGDVGECIACEYMHEYVDTTEVGGVAFVELETGELRRVEVVVAGALCVLACEEVTRERADRELAAFEETCAQSLH